MAARVEKRAARIGQLPRCQRSRAATQHKRHARVCQKKKQHENNVRLCRYPRSPAHLCGCVGAGTYMQRNAGFSRECASRFERAGKESRERRDVEGDGQRMCTPLALGSATESERCTFEVQRAERAEREGVREKVCAALSDPRRLFPRLFAPLDGSGSSCIMASAAVAITQRGAPRPVTRYDVLDVRVSQDRLGLPEAADDAASD